MIDAALFDWDGTLSDSRAALLASFHESTESVLGRRYPADAAEEDVVFTVPGSHIWPSLARDTEQAELLAESFQASYERHSRSIRPFPGVVEMLSAVRDAGVRIAVVTSKGRRRFDPDAARSGLAAHIDVSVCSGEAPAKPDPGCVLEALGRLGVSPDGAAMVGDTFVDIAAAHGAGVEALGVAWGHCSAASLHDAGASAVAQTPAELASLLIERHNGT